jgi:hypothetical protein
MKAVEIFTLIFLALLAHSITREYFTRFKKPYVMKEYTTQGPQQVDTTWSPSVYDVTRQPNPGEGVFQTPQPTEPPPCFNKTTDNAMLPDGVNHFPAYYEGENMLDSPCHYKEIITG